MKKKIVLWGTNEKEEKLLLGIELLDKENKVKIYSFPEESATEAFYNQMMNLWRSGNKVIFPEKHDVIERELSVTDNLLPDEIRVERTDIINRAKTEWHFVVLSSKLHQTYLNEVEDFKEKIAKLDAFDSGMWEEMKAFWSKVQNQSREKNLFREHADELRNHTNALFESLKSLKKKLDDEFGKISKDKVAQFMTTLANIEDRIEKGLGLQPIFNELKNVQADFKNTEFTRGDRSKVWKKLDGAFKKVKEKKFGSSGPAKSGLERVNRRFSGLLSAIDKMQSSIQRDRNDLKFQNKRIETTDGQLEMQIRQAKTKMIEERINSKDAKLQEMLKTKADLEKKIEIEKKRDEEKKVKEAVKLEEKKVKEKIASEIQTQKEGLEDKAEKLEKAAAEIKEGKKKVEKPAKTDSAPMEAAAAVAVAAPIVEQSDNIVEAISATVGEAIENVVDTVKAVAEVVEDKIEEVIEGVKEEVQEMASELTPESPTKTEEE